MYHHLKNKWLLISVQIVAKFHELDLLIDDHFLLQTNQIGMQKKKN